MCVKPNNTYWCCGDSVGYLCAIYYTNYHQINEIYILFSFLGISIFFAN